MNGGVQTVLPAAPVPEFPHGGYPATTERFTLVRRIAKLVARTGEFVCVVCEISRTEVTLRLFHPLPGEPRFALELPNGDCYFIEKLWERDREARFRFSTPIDTAAFIFEASPFAKRQIRLRTVLPATLSFLGSTGEAVIRDLSQEGARIEASHPPALYQRVRIDAEPCSSPMFATVHWKSRLQFGVLFERPFSLEELARMAWSLHDPAISAVAGTRRFEVVRTAPQEA